MATRYIGITLASLLAGAFSVANPVLAQQQQPAQQQLRPIQEQSSVYDTLMSDPRFSTTIKMVYVAGSANRLQNANNVTIFAPTNTGWDASSYEGMLSSLSSTGAGSEFPQPMAILQVLRGFFVRGEPAVRTQAPDVQMQSVAQRPIEFDKADGLVKWVDENGDTKSAKLAGQPIQATNGVIYPVNAVVGS